MGFEFMYGAYSVAWVVIFGYMVILGKRHTKLKKEIEFLKQLER
jgi:CcmD family protein